MGALGRDAAWEGCWVAQSNCHSEAVSEPIMGRSLLAGTAPPPILLGVVLTKQTCYGLSV